MGGIRLGCLTLRRPGAIVPTLEKFLSNSGQEREFIMARHEPFPKTLFSSILVAACFALAACEEPPPEAEKGTLEQAGESAGDALSNAGKSADALIEAAGETATEVMDKTGETLEAAGKELEKAGKGLQKEEEE